jgi:hypothetical protein
MDEQEILAATGGLPPSAFILPLHSHSQHDISIPPHDEIEHQTNRPSGLFDYRRTDVNSASTGPVDGSQWANGPELWCDPTVHVNSQLL